MASSRFRLVRPKASLPFPSAWHPHLPPSLLAILLLPHSTASPTQLRTAESLSLVPHIWTACAPSLPSSQAQRCTLLSDPGSPIGARRCHGSCCVVVRRACGFPWHSLYAAVVLYVVAVHVAARSGRSDWLPVLFQGCAHELQGPEKVGAACAHTTTDDVHSSRIKQAARGVQPPTCNIQRAAHEVQTAGVGRSLLRHRRLRTL